MCIIAVKPAEVKISQTYLENMWHGNSDGAGIMYAEGGKVRIIKGLMKFGDLEAAVREVGMERKFVMHFRIRTHGKVIPELTHPFWIEEDGLAMAHNGIISSVLAETSETESDTLVYARKIAARNTDSLETLTDPVEYSRIVSEIGYSKLVFMDRDGMTGIVNASLGTWDDGVWYSNSSYKNSFGCWTPWSSWQDDLDEKYSFSSSSNTSRSSTSQSKIIDAVVKAAREDRKDRDNTWTVLDRRQRRSQAAREDRKDRNNTPVKKLLSHWDRIPFSEDSKLRLPALPDGISEKH